MEAIRAVQDRVKRARQENAPSASGSASTPPASTAGLPESSAAPDVSQPAAALADPDTPATPTSSDVLSLSNASGGALEADAEPGGFSVGDESGDEGSCGYDSDEEATMTVVRSAFLVHGAERAAYGEFRPSDGVFAVESVVVVVEWSRRVFTPMLEALGPKYAATCDCFMRTLQVHAASASRLCTSYTPPASPTPSLLSGLRPIAVRAARYRLSLCQHRACRCGGATARCA